MTDERTEDKIVSARYRELANETTPAHLDQAVLRMAADRTQHPQYARSLTWTRPLAWAATIVLCLAITLEVTRDPVHDAIVSEPLRQAPLAEKPLSEEPVPERRDSAVSLPALKSEAAKLPASVADESSDSEAQENAAPPLDKRAHPAALRARESDAVQLRVEQTMAGAAAGAIPAPCSDAVKAKPETWLQCIAELEEAGATEAASLEKESLVEVFPDFRMP